MKNGGAAAPPYQSIFMCGIIGYVGKKSASPVLLEGLRRLEYRGYDSAGIAVLQEADLVVRKKLGRIDSGLAAYLQDNTVSGLLGIGPTRWAAARVLPLVLQANPFSGSLGIGHTRWATHGVPSDRNCHPHFDQAAKIAVVHN